MHWNTDSARLVGERAGYGLTDPPRRIGRKFVPFGPVEFFHRAEQTEVTLLDEIEQAQVPAHVLFSDRHYEPQVRLGEFLPRRHIPFGDALGEFHLFISFEQGNLADLPKIHLDGIIVYIAQIIALGRGHAAFALRSLLDGFVLLPH